MTSIDKLIELAKGLGFEAQAAMDFALSQQKLKRDERETLRLAKKEEKEADDRRILAEKEADERRIIAEERRLLAEKERMLAEKEKMVAEKERMIAEKDKIDAEKQKLAMAKELAEMEKADRERDFNLKLKAMDIDKEKTMREFTQAETLKREEFHSMLEKARIEKETKIQISQIEAAKPTVGLQNYNPTNTTKYIPRLPPYQESDSLPIFLGRFVDSMRAALIPEGQLVTRLRDLLTGKLLKTFQDLPDSDKLSFDTVAAKLLASQNLTTEHYRLEFSKAEPASDRNFSDYISSLKSTLDRWLQLAKVNTFQGLYDLIIKNKVYQSCNASLVSFLQERDPSTLDELTKLGDQYYSAHPNVKVQKDTPFQAFACETSSVMSEEDVADAYAAQTRPTHQSRSTLRH